MNSSDGTALWEAAVRSCAKGRARDGGVAVGAFADFLDETLCHAGAPSIVAFHDNALTGFWFAAVLQSLSEADAKPSWEVIARDPDDGDENADSFYEFGTEFRKWLTDAIKELWS